MQHGLEYMHRNKIYIMKIRTYFLLFLIVISLGLFSFCGNNSKEDPFYTTKGGFDDIRIPLIKPYIVENIGYSDGKPWMINCFYMETLEDPFSVLVSHLNVVSDSVIIFYNDGRKTYYGEITHTKTIYGDTVDDNPSLDTTWGLIIPSKKKEVVFENRNDFNEYLKLYSNEEVSFIDIDDLWKQFSENDYLKWFPEEYKEK
jgi:hypothetical protein